MPLPPALAARLAKRGILQQSDTNATKSTKQQQDIRNSEVKLAEENAALKEKEDNLMDLKLKVVFS